MIENTSHQEVLEFWFNELQPKDWFAKSVARDDMIINRFADVQRQAGNNELYTWRREAESALAEIILLDQFSRNMYRDNAQCFAHDALALALSMQAIEKGFDQQLIPLQRGFMYMPFMHSESLVVHELAVQLFTQLSNQQQLDYEYKHKVIIERFGRYPHRNAILGRVSTEQERVFLQQPGSSF